MAACVVAIGCAPLMGRPKQTQIDNPNQVEALTRAQVWQPTNVESMDVRRGPRDRGAFAPMATDQLPSRGEGHERQDAEVRLR